MSNSSTAVAELWTAAATGKHIYIAFRGTYARTYVIMLLLYWTC